MSHDLALRQSKESRASAKNFVQARGLLADLQRVTMSNRSLDREHTVVSNMARGLEVVLEMKKPGLAAAYLHRQLNKEASEEDAVLHRQVHKDIKEITSVNGKNSFPTLPAWDPSASRSSGLPEYNPLAARSGRSVRGRRSLN